MVGLNAVALSPWKSAAGSPLQSLFADNSVVLMSSCLSACLLTIGDFGGAISSVAEAVMILSSATCALAASIGETSW